MNVELLEKVKKRIVRSPKRLNMKYWGDRVIPGFHKDQMLEEPPCHTQACLAGETVLAGGIAVITKKVGGITWKNKSFVHSLNFKHEATQLLQLSPEQAERLFMFKSWNVRIASSEGWPTEFEQRYNEATTPRERAKVTCARIDHFIKTNGAE